MKQKKRTANLALYQNQTPRYPNAASSSYVTRKILDVITAIASGIGLITAMVFLISLT